MIMIVGFIIIFIIIIKQNNDDAATVEFVGSVIPMCAVRWACAKKSSKLRALCAFSSSWLLHFARRCVWRSQTLLAARKKLHDNDNDNDNANNNNININIAICKLTCR